MSWLQNDVFNEMVEEARQEAEAQKKSEEAALLAEFDLFDQEVSQDRLYKDIDFDDELIEKAIGQEYWETAWYATCSRHRLMEDLMQIRQGGH